jgi:hypothetical protein
LKENIIIVAKNVVREKKNTWRKNPKTTEIRIM